MKKIATMILSSVFAVSLVGAVAFLGDNVQTEKVAVAETGTTYTTPTLATAEDFGITENPNASGTHDQYIWNASEAGKLYSFTPTYIASKQATWDSNLKTNALVGIYLDSDVSFATSNIKWSGNAGYIYYGLSYDATGDDLKVSRTEAKPGGGYAYSNKGGKGWMAYVTNIKNTAEQNFNPPKMVFKKGFAIAMTDGSVYALAEDYAVYNINGAYLSARTTEEFLTNVQSAGLTVTTQEMDVTGVSYSGTALSLTTDTNINSGYGNYSVNSESIKLNGNNVSSWAGYVDTSNTKRLQYDNVSMTLTEGDEFVVEQGFTSIWGVNSTTIYAVKTKSDYKTSYVNGAFMKQGTRDWYIWNAQHKGIYNEITPKAITSVQSGDSTNTLKNSGGVSIFIDTDKNLAKSNIAWDNNAGYIYYGTSYDDENLKVSTNGNGAQATGYVFTNGGGVGKAVYIMNVKESSYNASKPAKVVLKAGFMLALTDGTVFSLKEDYTLYNVNGSYLPAKDIAELQEKYTTTQVDTVAINYVTKNDTSFTFGTDKTLFDPNSNPCGTFGALTLNDSALSTWSGYVISNSAQFVLSGVSSSLAVGDVLKMTDFSTVFYSVAENKFYVVQAKEETAFRYTAGGFVGRYTVTQTVNGEETKTKVFPGDSYALGTESNNGKIFIGWNVNGELKQANTSVVVNTNLTVVPQWIDYSLQAGAWIRWSTNVETSGIRFVADLDKASYEANSAYIKKIGIIMMPKDMLNEADFTLSNYTTGNASTSALDFSLASKEFSFTAEGNLSLGATIQKLHQENYNKDIMARAYVVVNYGGEDVYLYADMNEENVRSIYTLAKTALEGTLSDEKRGIAQAYVNYVDSNQ